MATLTSTKIKNTYDALLKSIDNDAIGTTAKQITDGLGNVTPLYVSTTQVGIGVTPESGLNLHVFGDAKIGSNLTVIGNLVVEGSTTTVGTDTLTVKDPLIVLANNNTSTDAVDIGFYGKYHPSGTTLYSGLFREALTGKYRLFKGLEVEPTTTVNTSGTGYAQATLIANLEGNVTGNLIGSVTGGTFSGTLLSNVVATTQSAGDNSTKVATTAYVDNQVGLYDTLSEVLANGNTTGGTDIAVSAGDDITFTDTSKSIYGIDGELEIHHNGTNSYITEDGTGALYLQGTYMYLTKSDGSQNYIELDLDGATDSRVKLNYGGATKLTTTSTGVSITGNINLGDNNKILLGDSDDVEMYFDGATQFGIINDTVGGGIFLRSNSFAFTNGTNEFYSMSSTTHQLKSSGTTRLTVNSTGIDVNGNINIGDNEKIIFGDGGDIEMFFNSSTFVIDDTSEVQQGIDIDTNRVRFRGTDLYMEIGNAQHTFWTNGTQRLQINSSGVNVSSDFTVNTDTLFVDYSADSVGIGLTNPSDYSADELVISVPDDSGMTLVSGTTDTAYIRFADGTTAAAQSNFISHDHSTDNLTIFSQAKVSIGIQEAIVAYFTDVDFVVDKSTTIDDTLTVNGNVEIADSDNTLLYLNSSTANVYLRLDDSGSTNGNFIGATSNDMHFWTNNTERMRIDSSGNVGIGTTVPASELQVGGTDLSATANFDAQFAVLSEATTGYPSGFIFKAPRVATSSNRILLNEDFGTYFSTQVYATSTGGAQSDIPIVFAPLGGNVGIGTDSPTAKLDIRNGELTVRPSSSGNGGLGKIGHSSNNALLQLYDSSGTEDVRISTSLSSYFNGGNVGIGTTSPGQKLEVAGRIRVTTDPTIEFYETSNKRGGVQWNATNDYVNMFAVGGDIRFDIGGERMRIDSSGNVGINRTSIAQPSSGAITLAIQGTSTTKGGAIRLYSSDDSVAAYIYPDNTNGLSINTSTSHPIVFRTAGTERMRIDSSGNVGIGGTPSTFANYTSVTIKGGSSGSNLDFKNSSGTRVAAIVSNPSSDFGIETNEATPILFKTNGAERMRITSGGTVGNTGSTLLGGGAAEGVTGWNFAPGNGTIITSSDSDSNMYIGKVSGYSNDRFISFYVNGSLVGRITTNGSTTSYVTTSDYRAKENVVEMTGALDRVSQLKPSRFNFIADADTTVDGFLAHEVQEIVPEAISGEKDAMRTEEYEVTPAVYEDVVHPAEEAVYETIEHPAVEEELDDEGNVIVEGKEAYTEEVLVTEAKEEWTEKVLVSEKVMGTREVPDYQGIDQSKLVPLLVGAIQEQQQIINDLKSRIETLENN